MSDEKWDVDRILAHVTADLPIAALFGIEIVAAQAGRSRVRLNGNAQITRPAGVLAAADRRGRAASRRS